MPWLNCIVASPSLEAQRPPEPVFSMDVKRVVLYATVREGKAKFAGHLQPENFTILEDSRPQKIISLSRGPQPTPL